MLFESVVIFLRTMCGLWVGIWLMPFMYQSIRTTLGAYKHILFLDEQLASKEFEKRNNSELVAGLDYTFPAIGSRFHRYCFMFPFIKNRATTKRKSFWVLMWLNSFWLWSIVVFVVLVFISESLEISKSFG